MPNRFYEITEGRTEARPLSLRRFDWPNPKADDESTF
jgi:hypothetical protein